MNPRNIKILSTLVFLSLVLLIRNQLNTAEVEKLLMRHKLQQTKLQIKKLKDKHEKEMEEMSAQAEILLNNQTQNLAEALGNDQNIPAAPKIVEVYIPHSVEKSHQDDLRSVFSELVANRTEVEDSQNASSKSELDFSNMKIDLSKRPDNLRQLQSHIYSATNTNTDTNPEINRQFPPRKADIIIFNRMPKTGSTVLVNLINRLHEKTFLDYKISNEVTSNHLSPHFFKSDFNLMAWVKQIYRTAEPTIIMKSQYFVNLEAGRKQIELNMERSVMKSLEGQGVTLEMLRSSPQMREKIRLPDRKILWINFVRDPVEQFISNYYYNRKGLVGSSNKARNHNWFDYVKKNSLIDPETKNLSLDECIEQKFEECIYPQSEFLSFFCGNKPMCRPDFLHSKKYYRLDPSNNHKNTTYNKSNTERKEDLNKALERAKSNIQQNYFIVGYLEKQKEFIQFVNNALPNYFRGSNFLYGKYLADGNFNKTYFNSKTAGKDSEENLLSEDGRKFLNDKLKYERLLYQFIVQEFERRTSEFRSKIDLAKVRDWSV